MAIYRIEIVRSAEKALYRLPKEMAPKVVAAIQSLALDPFPSGFRKLSGTSNVYRIRVNVYRIIYEIHANLVLVRVLKIGHRKDVYRGVVF